MKISAILSSFLLPILVALGDETNTTSSGADPFAILEPSGECPSDCRICIKGICQLAGDSKACNPGYAVTLDTRVCRKADEAQQTDAAKKVCDDKGCSICVSE